MTQTIFEQPLNERIRTFLRMQQLFEQIDYQLQYDARWSLHAATNVLLDIYNLSTRSDLKSEVMKELDRQQFSMQQLCNEEIDETSRNRYADSIPRMAELTNRLHDQHGQLFKHIKENEFLKSIQQRSTVSSSACSYDLPMFHHWLSRPADEVKENLREWLMPYQTLRESIDTAIGSIRNCAEFTNKTASRGFFQETLHGTPPLQLVRVQRTDDENVYPEMSAGRHRITIRFIHYVSANEKSAQALDDIHFDIAYCAI